MLSRASDEDLCSRRNLGVRLHVLSNQSFFVHELSIQQGCAGGAADRVVAQQPEFEVEHVTRNYGADNDGHALTAIAVAAWLRPLDV